MRSAAAQASEERRTHSRRLRSGADRHGDRRRATAWRPERAAAGLRAAERRAHGGALRERARGGRREAELLVRPSDRADDSGRGGA